MRRAGNQRLLTNIIPAQSRNAVDIQSISVNRRNPAIQRAIPTRSGIAPDHSERTAMPPRKVQFVAGAYYHPYNRGARQQAIFCSNQDYRTVLQLMGNTLKGGKPLAGNAVHPHPCGEYTSASLSIELDSGSPHACGEYRPRSVHRFPLFGSPPRLWGIHPGRW